MNKTVIEKHQEVCESIVKWAKAIAREGLYSDISVYREDLKDGKVTFRFSLTPAIENKEDK